MRSDRRGNRGMVGRGRGMGVVGDGVGVGMVVDAGDNGGLARVIRWCVRGAARIWAGAVGLVEVWRGPPFEVLWVGHGMSSELLGLPANFVMVCVILVSSLFLLARGSGAMHRMSSLNTRPVCSYGVTVGRLQCVGYSS